MSGERHGCCAYGAGGRDQRFLQGKTVNLLIGVGGGGEYDANARLTGRHIGKHIPGNPNIVPQNMVGAIGVMLILVLLLVTVSVRILGFGRGAHIQNSESR